MKVFINNKKIEIFTGARVKDALLKYSKKDYHLVLKGERAVVDTKGNEISLDGEVSEGEIFFIKMK